MKTQKPIQLLFIGRRSVIKFPPLMIIAQLYSFHKAQLKLMVTLAALVSQHVKANGFPVVVVKLPSKNKVAK